MMVMKSRGSDNSAHRGTRFRAHCAIQPSTCTGTENKGIGALNLYMDGQKLPPNLEARTAEK